MVNYAYFVEELQKNYTKIRKTYMKQYYKKRHISTKSYVQMYKCTNVQKEWLKSIWKVVIR